MYVVGYIIIYRHANNMHELINGQTQVRTFEHLPNMHVQYLFTSLSCVVVLHLHQPSPLASSYSIKTGCIPSIEIICFAFSLRGLAKRICQKRACSVLPKEARSSKPGIQPFRGMHTFRSHSMFFHLRKFWL